MRIHRLFTSPGLAPGGRISLENGAAHYLGRVLRAATGDTVVLFNGDGHDYVSEITAVSRKIIDLEIRCRVPARRESPLEVTLVQAVGRGERMDQSLQKCTELGADGFLPLLSERVELKLGAEKLEKRRGHWQGVVVSACEQSGRAVVPEVGIPVDVRTWLSSETPCRRLVLDPQSERPISALTVVEPLELAVGPEGGFTEAERDRMSAHGVESVSIGPRILRTETAGPAALAILQALAGDF